MPERPSGELLKRLRKRWPKCFGGYRPLKIGIREDILATPDLGLDAVEVRCVLGAYVRRARYLERMVVGAPRIDLDGNAVGEVTADDVNCAQYRLRNLGPAQKEWIRLTSRQKARRRRKAHRARQRLAAAEAEAAKAAAKAEAAAAAATARIAAAEAAQPRRLSLAGLKQAALERRARVA